MFAYQNMNKQIFILQLINYLLSYKWFAVKTLSSLTDTISETLYTWPTGEYYKACIVNLF